MSQILDIFGIDWRLLIIQSFNFGVLLVLLWYFLYRPVVGMIEKRRQEIEKGVRAAEAAREEKDKIESEREELIQEAVGESRIIVEEAKKRAGEQEAQLVRTAQERSERILEEAHDKAEEDKRRILESGKEEIARMIVLGAEKILRSKH